MIPAGQVSNDLIDAFYDNARAAGAWGGKVLGAGGGGFMLFCAPPEKHQAIRSALAPLISIPLRFSEGGTESVLVS